MIFDAKTIPFILSLAFCGGAAYAQNDALIISDGGYVGIGTAAPESPLHVMDNDSAFPMVFTAENTGGEFAGFRFTTTTGSIDFNKAGGNSFRLNIVDGDIWELQLDPAGNLTVKGNAYAQDHVNTSSRAFKTDFAPVNEQMVLQKLVSLPISGWQYKADNDDLRHVGPVAEDFHQLFGLGDSQHISTVDAAGVSMAAIKGLYRQIEKRDSKIDALEMQLQSLTARLLELESKQAAATQATYSTTSPFGESFAVR